MSSIINKIAVCCCCSECACCVGQCYDMWHGYEACGLAYLNCGACCWTVCAPICHTCSIGDISAGMNQCVKGIKHWLFACALYCVGPYDGCLNCVFYVKDIFTTGVTGFKDITKNSNFISAKIRQALAIETGNEPEKTFLTYTP
jgi:hypothetical protein